MVLLVLSLAIVPAAGTQTFLEKTYENLDVVVMTFYKPLIWWVLIKWTKGPACAFMVDKAITSMGITSNTLTADEQTTLCEEGVKMYWEQFFYGGAIGNQPYDLSWSWTA